MKNWVVDFVISKQKIQITIATQVRIDLYHTVFLFILLVHQMECNTAVILKRNHYIAFHQMYLT